MKLLPTLFIPLILTVSTINTYPMENTNTIDDTTDDDLVIDLSHFGNSIFGNPDNETGVILESYNPDTDTVNPEELGSYIEGDILMPASLKETGPGRNGLLAQTLRWPNGVVPYEISGDFNAFQMDLIEKAFNEYHSRTCIRFVPRSRETDYLSIQSSRTGCWSSVGRIGGRQEVNLQTPGCMTKIGTVIHELMHACGFLHEQNRYERDDYIDINWSNIKQGTENNFDKASSATTSGFGVVYDYGSVMHYSANAFSRNGGSTIIAKRRAPSMGQRDHFSSGDVAKLNAMYDCKNVGNAPDEPTRKPADNVGINPVLGFLGNLYPNVGYIGQRDGFSSGDVEKLNSMYNCAAYQTNQHGYYGSQGFYGR